MYSNLGPFVPRGKNFSESPFCCALCDCTGQLPQGSLCLANTAYAWVDNLVSFWEELASLMSSVIELVYPLDSIHNKAEILISTYLCSVSYFWIDSVQDSSSNTQLLINNKYILLKLITWECQYYQYSTFLRMFLPVEKCLKWKQ